MLWSWSILAVLALGLFLLFLISRRRNLTTGERNKVYRKWQELKELESQRRYKEAIMDADKLFDFVLKSMNVKGVTMGERLISAEKMLDNYHDIWEAHKIRNRLVHEVDFKADSRKAEIALKAFGRGIKYLKVM